MTTNPVEDYKLWLQAHLDELKAKCATDEERGAINLAYQTAVENYLRTINKTLEEGDQQVQNLTAQIDGLRARIEQDIQRQEDIGAIIDKIATGVELAGKLVFFFK